MTWWIDGDALNCEAATERKLRKAGWTLLNIAPAGHFWQRAWRMKQMKAKYAA
jgi:hypothetical protein